MPWRSSAARAGAERGAGRDRQHRQRREAEGGGVEQERGARRAEQEDDGADDRAGRDRAHADGGRSALAPGRSASGTSRGVVAAVHGGYGRGGGGGQPGEHRSQDDGQPGQRDGAQPEHEDDADQVGDDHRPAAVEAVGDHAAQRSEHDDRHDPRGGRGGQPAGAVGALVDEGQQRDVVEPVPRLRDGEPDQQPAEGAVPEGAAHRAAERRVTTAPPTAPAASR